jgi:hypothetical protein
LRAFLAAVFLVHAFAAAAAERSYAILSVAADRLLLSQSEMTTGSRLDRNTRQYLPIPDGSLDRMILRAVDAQVARIAREAKVVLLVSQDPKVFAASARAIDSGGIASLVPVVRGIVPPGAATHLILVTKHRAEARGQLMDGTTGQGLIEGLGFYLDRQFHTRDYEKGDTARGLIMPFAYLRFALIDLATGDVLREHPETLSSLVPSPSKTPWETLTDEDKARYLEQLVTQAAQRGVPALLR